MLVSLSIRDVVLIERLDLTFEDGLCVLTGETGAGKSIMLDALGLALGCRAEARLVRPGAERAVVSAAFELDPEHPALALLEDSGLDGEESTVVLRRQLGRDGRSRGFINDQPVSVALLRQVGDLLVEVQGQFEQRGLLDPSSHQLLLTAHGSLGVKARAVATRWLAWRQALDAESDAKAELAAARREEAFLRHAVGELAALEPKQGEIAELAAQRERLRHRERILEALDTAAGALSGDDARSGAETSLSEASRSLERVQDSAGDWLAPALDGLSRALAETEDVRARIHQLSDDLLADEGDLESVEARYFEIKELARKHGVEDDTLSDLHQDLTRKLASLDDGESRLEALSEAAAVAKEAYLLAARALSDGRKSAAKRLDKAINAELPPLKLDKARFSTTLLPLEEADWGPQGLERVRFEISTAPNLPPGPLAKVASGGELSRVLLALKVVLAAVESGPTLVFDEVDNGVGGATAHAVGERLERLAQDQQVLVVTHSPQVAARGTHHWCVRKEAAGDGLATRVGQVSDAARREEIARMLSGAEVTDEARAAADRLMGAA